MNTNGERGRFDTHRNAPAPLSTWYTPFLQRAFAPKSIISPKPFSLPKTRSNLPKHPIAVANTGFCRPISLRSIRAFVALFRCAQYGLLSPYFAALNTGSCYAIAPTRGQCAPPLRLCARRSAACAHTPTQPARIAVGNTGQSNTIHPIHIKMII